MWCYKIKLRPFAYWSNGIMTLFHVINGQLRRRIAVVPNDNSSAKSSRFKGLVIVRVQTHFLRSLEYAIACISPPSSPFINRLRNEITMTRTCRLVFKSHASSQSILRMNSTLRTNAMLRTQSTHRRRPAPSSSFCLTFFRLRFNSQRSRPEMRCNCFRPAM